MKVYLAGPDVFLPGATEQFAWLKKTCEEFGLEGLSPFDNEADLSGMNKNDMAREIYEANLDLIHRSDVVLANIDAFRGRHMDPGTAFEIGYATALGKKVFCYSARVSTNLKNQMGAKLGADGKFYDELGNTVEDFAMPENLMICVPAGQLFHWPRHAIEAIHAYKINREIALNEMMYGMPPYPKKD